VPRRLENHSLGYTAEFNVGVGLPEMKKRVRLTWKSTDAGEDNSIAEVLVALKE
jgi:hypothetical protein